jgi:hypothetical protein
MTSTSNTVNYTDFNPADLKFTKLEENERSNGQLVGYPRYSKNGVEIPLDIQLPWIKLFTYGVPQLNQFYKTDGDRSHLRVPLDLSDPTVAEFADKLKQIDSIMSSPEMMETLLGKKAKKYKYQPIYREGQTPEDESDDEDNKDKKKKPSAPRPPYFKLKLKLSYPDKIVESKVFESDEAHDTKKRTRTKLEVSTIDDFAKYVRYQSKIRCVAKPFKIWAHALSKKDPEFGISFRLERVEVDKASISGSYKSVFDSENFIDSDDELPKISNLTVNEKVNSKGDSSDDSSDDEKVTKPQTKIADVPSDDSSDDEIVTKPPVKNTKKAEPESDDSDEEVITKPPPKEKKGGKTKISKK